MCLIKDLNDSFQVELCKSFGDPSKPKAWSKHAQKAPASEKQTEKPVTSTAPAGTKKVSFASFLEALTYVSGLAEGRGQSSWDSRCWSPGSGIFCLRIYILCSIGLREK